MRPFRCFLFNWKIVIGAGVLAGCSHITYRNAAPTYVPQPPNVALLTTAGTAEADLSIGITGLNGQVAVAPVRHLVVVAQGQQHNRDKGRDRLHTGEIGIGFVGERLPDQLYGVYAGAGAGSGRSIGAFYEINQSAPFAFNSFSYYDSTDRTAAVRYTTAYLQPFVGGRSRDHRLEWAVGAKLNWVHYRALRYDSFYRKGARTGGIPTRDSVSITQIDRAGANRWHTQVSGTVATGLTPRVWLVLRAGIEVGVNQQQQWYEFSPLVASLGLRLRVGKVASMASPALPGPTAPNR